LPHQQQTALGRFLKTKAIWEIKVRVKQQQLCAGIAEEKRIGDFAPARMTVPKGAQIGVSFEEGLLAVGQVLL
jgi:hypothetical protein